MLGGLSEFVSSCGMLSYPHVFLYWFEYSKEQPKNKKKKRKKSGGEVCASVCDCTAFFDSCFSFFFASLPLNLTSGVPYFHWRGSGHYRRNLPCRGCIPQEV